MLPVLLADDVKRQDAEASARGISVEHLMGNAGWAVARAARELLGGTYGKRVVVVCGKGNNAGDGLVAGRLLHAQGAHATAVLTSDAHSDLTALNLERFPGRVVGMSEIGREIARADLVIDALLGVGLSRVPEGAVAAAIEACGQATAPILAVDVPTGIDSDTGQVPGPAIRARATVTFTGYKPGLLFAPGADLAGSIEIADIGIPGAPTGVSVLEARDVASWLPRRATASHKRKAGTVLVVAGSRAMPGAAALVSAASVQAGAGLTTLCAPEDVCRVVLGRVPEITTIPLSENSEGILDSKALDLLLPRLNEFTFVVIGPGLGTHPATVDAVRAIVESRQGPIVIDADGSNALAGSTEILQRRNERGFASILTPHAGELSRLVEKAASDLDVDRLGAARAAARDLRSIVVFKGPGTVIAGEETFINATGGPALAQGGTGDVLAGMVAGLLAQKGQRIGARDVAASVWLHGATADRIAKRVAPHPANASALIAELAATMHEVAG